ncbi:hypothetical protein D9M71_357290 [compost metagenome]
MLAEQRHQGCSTDDDQHEDQTLQARDFQVSTETADDGRDAHEAAVGVQRGNGDLAERDAEVQQRSGGTGPAQTHDVGHFVAGELPVGRSGSEHAEDHRHLCTNDRTCACGKKGFHRGNLARQVARIVSHIRAEGDLPGRRERHREQETAPAEVADLQQSANINLADQTAEQINKGNHANDTGNTADPMDHPITEHRDQHDDTGKNEDTDAVADAKQLAQRLAG